MCISSQNVRKCIPPLRSFLVNRSLANFFLKRLGLVGIINTQMLLSSRCVHVCPNLKCDDVRASALPREQSCCLVSRGNVVSILTLWFAALFGSPFSFNSVPVSILFFLLPFLSCFQLHSQSLSICPPLCYFALPVPPPAFFLTLFIAIYPSPSLLLYIKDVLRSNILRNKAWPS